MQFFRAIIERHRFHELALANRSNSCYINQRPTRPLSQNRMAGHMKLKECLRRHALYCAPTQTPTGEPFCSQPEARKTTGTMCFKYEARSCASFTMLRKMDISIACVTFWARVICGLAIRQALRLGSTRESCLAKGLARARSMEHILRNRWAEVSLHIAFCPGLSNLASLQMGRKDLACMNPNVNS